MGLRSWLQKLFSEAAPAVSRKPLAALVWLRRAHRPIGADEMADLAEQAFGAPFAGYPEVADNYVTGEGPSLLLKYGDHTYLISSYPHVYCDDPDVLAPGDDDPHLRLAVALHQAWVSVDLLGQAAPDQVEEVYRVIGRLMAVLADRDCLVAYGPATDRLSAASADLLERMRSGHPLDLFDHPAGCVSEDDPRMRAAIAEARWRWPEFVHAFEERRPYHVFAVKARVTEPGGAAEHVWIAVTALEGDGVYGAIDSEPLVLRRRKRGDRLRVTVNNVSDWLWLDGTHATGGFTIEVLQQILRGSN